jgi:HD superfamily phosphohydrolase
MANDLGLDENEKHLVRLAALLHDIGHGPFSHVSEASLIRFADQSTLKPGQKADKIHELITAKIIASDPDLSRLVEEDHRTSVVQILNDTWNGRPLLRQIISGPLDADKQDYLLRDSKFCGVEYGIFDPQQLQRSLVSVGPSGDEELMIDPDGVHAVEQFVMAKYYMTTNVYRHRVRVITDQMIGRAIRLGIVNDKVDELGRLFRFDNSEEFVRLYQQWDDSRFMDTFCPLHGEPPGALSGELLRRLRSRRLLKLVYSDRLEDCDPRTREVLKNLAKTSSDNLRDRIENAAGVFLSEKLGIAVAPEFVIAHAFGIKSVRDSAKNEEAEMLVNRGVTPRYFSDESRLFGSINAAYADNFVEVYAPIEWPDLKQRDQTRDEWRPELREVIKGICLEDRRTSP